MDYFNERGLLCSPPPILTCFRPEKKEEEERIFLRGVRTDYKHSCATAAAVLQVRTQPSKLKTITNLSSVEALCASGPQRNQWAEGVEWLLIH